MAEKLENLRKFIKEKELEGYKTFHTRNLIGDEMETIYNKDNVIVDICYDYDYLEIFGLSEKEYNSLRNILDVC